MKATYRRDLHEILRKVGAGILWGAPILLSACQPHGVTGSPPSGTTVGTTGGTGGGTPGVAAVTTYHYDNQRSGWNSQESQLDYSNVNNSSLSVQAVHLDDVNDQVDAQPLVALKVQMAGGKHDVVYVATEANNIYAFDAYSGARLKVVNLGPPVQVSCQYNGPVVGITGTPAIDVSSSTMYVVTYNTDSSNHPVYFIHALDLGTLTDKVPPQQITASQTLDDGKTTFQFNAAWQRQRPGLLVANGNIYVGFGGFCDAGGDQARGWILGFQGGSLTPLPANLLTNTLSSEPNGMFLSGVWMSGYGIAGDQNGIYFSTGNSDPGGTTYNENVNIADSVVRLNSDLTRPTPTTKFLFTPGNVKVLDQNDLDMSAGGVMLLPSQPGPVSNMAVATGKDGRMFLLNRDNLGGNNDTGALNVVEIGNRCWCGPTYFNDGTTLHIVSSGGISPTNTVGPNPGISHNSVGLWNLQTSPAPTLSQSASGNMPDTIQDPGFFTTVSSNGNKNAIIWAVSRPQSNSQNPLLWLYAFKATPAGNTLPQLFQSPAGSWPYTGGNANVVPVVANGKVYVASYKELDIFGVNPQSAQGGQKVTTKATARTEVARAEVAKGPEEHQVSGVVLKIDGDRLTIQTRNNNTVEIDATEAKKSLRYSAVIPVGSGVLAVGTYDTQGVMHAVTLWRMKASHATWPPDR